MTKIWYVIVLGLGLTCLTNCENNQNDLQIERELALKKKEYQLNKKEKALLSKERNLKKVVTKSGKTLYNCNQFIGSWRSKNDVLLISPNGDLFNIKNSHGLRVENYTGTCNGDELKLDKSGSVYLSDETLVYNDREYSK